MAFLVASQQRWGIVWSLLLGALAVAGLVWEGYGIRRRYVERSYDQDHHGPYADDERGQLEAMRRRLRVVCWCILPVAAALVVLSLYTTSTVRVFLLIFSLTPAATSIYILLLMAAKQRRGILPGQS